MTEYVVAFIDGCGDYIQVRERTDSVIRGWIINGHWDVHIDLVAKTVSLDLECRSGGPLEHLSRYEKIEIIPAPSDGDYNEVIEDARLLANRIP